MVISIEKEQLPKSNTLSWQKQTTKTPPLNKLETERNKTNFLKVIKVIDKTP